MALSPLLVLFLSVFVMPMAFNSIDPANHTVLKTTMLFMIILLLAVGSSLLAAMATFLLLEHKDENTLKTIAVTPTGASGYLRFKLTYVYVMSFLGIIMVLLGTKLIAGDKYSINGVSMFDSVNVYHIIAFAAVDSIFAPFLALLQSAFAKNKVEGFAYIKGSGIVVLIPALMLLKTFQGSLQYALGVFPNFWAIKAMMLRFMPADSGANLSFPVYLIIGLAYNILLLIVSYRLFLKKAQYLSLIHI